MDTSTEPPAMASRYGSMRCRPAGYWLATGLVVAELGLGGIWDIARIPFVRDLVTHLGYPSYFLVLLGSWKVLGAAALLVPRRALLKEWAYAGAFFTYTGAIVSLPEHRLRPRRGGAAGRHDSTDRTVLGPATPQPPHAPLHCAVILAYGTGFLLGQNRWHPARCRVRLPAVSSSRATGESPHWPAAGLAGSGVPE
jgi:hypothetical protein